MSVMYEKWVYILLSGFLFWLRINKKVIMKWLKYHLKIYVALLLLLH